MPQQCNCSQSSVSPEVAESKVTPRIGGSYLPSSEPSILQLMPGQHGTFQVRALAELDTHGLFCDARLIATHPNGYSCHELAKRVLSVWRGEQDVAYAMAQFDYLLDCGGLGMLRSHVERIARGEPY